MPIPVSRRNFAFGLFLAFVCAPFAAGKDPGLAPPEIKAIEQAILAGMSRAHIPGLSAAVGMKDGVAWSAGFGMADLENSVPAKAGTMYRLASISKPITAVAVMQLVEKHRMELDAPVQTYVPLFPEQTTPLTIRHLLCHVGGIRHYQDVAEMDSTRHYTDLAEPLGIFIKDPLLFEPGTKYSYTTYGYVLLGAALERASGLKFSEYLNANIFGPAQMDRIRTDDVYDIIPGRARGYRLRQDGTVQNCSLADTSNKIPGGGLISAPADLVKFALAVSRGILVNKETADQMFAPQRLADGTKTAYGLGWNIIAGDGETWVGHSGGQQGVSTFLLLIPKRQTAVALMANLEGVNLSGMAAAIARIVLE